MSQSIVPLVLPKNLGTFEVFASTALVPEVSGGAQTDRFTAQLQNFTTGPQLLPGLDVQYEDAQGKSYHLKTPDLQVTFGDVPANPKDKGDIREIRGVIGPVAWSPLWWLAAALLLAAVGFFLWHKRKRALAGPPPPPPVPADEQALKKLRELQASDWIATGRLKEFYSALSEIMREYLERGFQIPALERTTSELLRDVRHQARFSSEQFMTLKELLEAGDLVKFAKFRPDADEALKDHALTTRFVEGTRSLLSSSASAGGVP